MIAEYGDEPEFITALGIKIFPTNEQFVKDAKTGRIIKRDKEVRYLGRDEEKGFHFYISEGTTLSEHEKSYPSFVKEKVRD